MTPLIADHAATLDEWLDLPMNRANLSAARSAFDGLAETLRFAPELRDQFAPKLLNVFIRTGYVKDYKALRQFARRVRRPELLEAVQPVLKSELPDVWIKEALDRGDHDDALAAWFEHEAHDRARLCAPQILKAFGDQTDVLVSAQLSLVAYQIGRGGRSRYRRAARLLIALREQLVKRSEPGMWEIAREDLLNRYGHRPALMDELAKAEVV